jgi:hypothetical protein
MGSSSPASWSDAKSLSAADVGPGGNGRADAGGGSCTARDSRGRIALVTRSLLEPFAYDAKGGAAVETYSSDGRPCASQYASLHSPRQK